MGRVDVKKVNIACGLLFLTSRLCVSQCLSWFVCRGVASNLIWVGINGSRRQNNHIKN